MECHTTLSVRTVHVAFMIIHLQIHLKQLVPTVCSGLWQLTQHSNKTLIRNYEELNFQSPRLVKDPGGNGIRQICLYPPLCTWGWFETLNCPTRSWPGNQFAHLNQLISRCCLIRLFILIPRCCPPPHLFCKLFCGGERSLDLRQ